MYISKITPNYTLLQQYNATPIKKINADATPKSQQLETTKIPLGFRYGANISFGEFFDPNRTVPHIDYEEYMAMNDVTKQRFRKRYKTFYKDSTIDKSEMFDKNNMSLPLSSDKSMKEFIKVAKYYTKYKDQPIICLGRSPKWFLNAALWMKDGINDYKYVAFSKFWYRPDYREGVKRLDGLAPTDEEKEAYKKYLKRIKADPETIVKHMRETGKKTVITDYLCSGKGACSFLEIMADYADEKGILEEFSKSIEIVGIGNLEYQEELNPYADSVDIPTVPMPQKLRPYSKNIPQKFENIEYFMFREMLLNQNTNECRSTYYPHETWTLYKPDKFRTGLIKDMKKVEEMIKRLKSEKSMSSFTPAMYDFRNLLNFRILDALYKEGLLKENHKSKV